ncbi:hypothetical protein AN643_01660 [Candidatus Epulonipiscioides saccharophilum]|nr:hypothetical protein AN643_01660 [Epulopiscium sp. SCG-B10WGA-EpuloB]
MTNELSAISELEEEQAYEIMDIQEVREIDNLTEEKGPDQSEQNAMNEVKIRIELEGLEQVQYNEGTKNDYFHRKNNTNILEVIRNKISTVEKTGSFKLYINQVIKEYKSDAKYNPVQGFIIKWFKTRMDSNDEISFITREYYNKSNDSIKSLARHLKVLEQLPILRKYHDNLTTMSIRDEESVSVADLMERNKYTEQLVLEFVKEYYARFNKIRMMPESEWQKYLLYLAGIIKYDAGAQLICYGLLGLNLQEETHQGLEGFNKEKEEVNLSMNLLKRMISIKSKYNKNIYLLEDKRMFSKLVKEYPDQSFIFIGGELTAICLILLNHLKKDHQLYYSGQYSPEGIIKAQELKNIYTDKLKWFSYNSKSYKDNMTLTKISEKRFKILSGIRDIELIKITQEMRRLKREAGQMYITEGFELPNQI